MRKSPIIPRTRCRGRLTALCALAVMLTAVAARPSAQEPWIVAIGAGSNFALALDSEGGVWAWGRNGAGQLGDGTTTNRLFPVRVSDPSDATGFLTNIVAISAGGFNHALALKNNGTVWAWGGNIEGELGDGTSTNRRTPIQVRDPSDPTGFLQGVVDIAGGSQFSLALMSDGTIRAWGLNGVGQLGDSTTTNRLTPVRVVDPTDATGLLTDIVAFAAGGSHSLALMSNGTVRAWGANPNGQIGDGTTLRRLVPVQVADFSNPTGLLTDVTGVRAGGTSSLALATDGTMRAWGSNSSGQLGDGTMTDRHTAVQVSNLANIISIGAGGRFSLAVKADGTAWSWGLNSNGQLGDGTTINRLTPVQVVDPRHPKGFLRGVASVAASGSFSLSLKDDGGVRAWGLRGSLGDGTDAIRPFPVQVIDPATPTGFLMGITAISAGSGVSIAHTSGDTVRAWGGNASGQLGDGTTNKRTAPVDVIDPGDPSGLLTGVWAVDASSHSLAIKVDGTIRAWGQGTAGQLGDGLRSNSPVPVRTRDLDWVVQVSAGGGYSLALKGDGTVWAWGFNGFGRLGDATTTTRSTPVQVRDFSDRTGFLTGATAIEAGDAHSLALLMDGTVRAWGENTSGQLGDSTLATRVTPVQVLDLSDPSGFLTGVVKISAGGAFSLALKNDGTVRAWGVNGQGSLGDGTTVNRTTAQQVIDLADPTGFLTNVVAIAAGNLHGVALKADGTVRTWGTNGGGQLGDGTTEQRVVPVVVRDPSDPTGFLSAVTAISAEGHTMALKSDGTVWAWGTNGQGQIGDGTNPITPTPVRVRFPD